VVAGRQRELAEVERALDELGQGTGGLVLISGDAGIGKTRLCEESATRAAARGFTVGWARFWEADATSPFWPWEQLLRQLTEPAVPAAKAITYVEDPGLARLRFFDEVVARVRGVATARPVVLVIEDLHSGDAASIALLEYVVSSRPSIPALVLATYRTDEIDPATPFGHAIVALARLGRHLPLRGLTVDELPVLVEAVTPDHRGVDVAALHHVTGGNPLFAQELLRLLDAHGTLDDFGSGEAPPVPPTVRVVLARHLARLTAECRSVLETAAVVGDEFSLAVVSMVTSISRRRLLKSVGEALAAHVVAEAGVAEYTFAHPLIRATLYDDLGVAQRVRLHERVGRVLEDRREAGHEVDPAALAHHFIRAAPGGSAAKAATYAVEAAESAMRGFAYERAARLYEQALSASELDPSATNRGVMLLGLGGAQLATGSLAAARKTYLKAAELARVAGDGGQLAQAALGVGGGGGFEVALADREQIALLEEARVAMAEQPSALRALVTARLSVALSLTGAIERRIALSEEALAMARVVGESGAVAHALSAHCDAIAGPGDTSQRLAESTEIIELAAANADRATEMLGRRLRIVALLELGHTGPADAEIEAFARLSDLIRQPLYGWYVPLWRGTRALMRGDLAACEAFAEEAAAIGARAESDNAAVLTETLELYLRREAGRLDHDAVLARLAPYEAVLGTQLRVTAALILADAGRVDEARARLDADQAAIRALPVDSEWLPSMVQLAQTIAGIGGHGLGPWAYETLLPYGHLFGVEGIAGAWCGSIERALGLLAATVGRTEDAASHFDAAVAANRAAGAPLFVARTLRDAGMSLGDRERIAAALDAYRDLRIESRIAEVEAWLSARPPRAAVGVFRREGDVWTLGYDGTLVRLKDLKGLRDLAALLARPRQEVHVTAFIAAPEAPRQRDVGGQLDTRARAAYKARLAELATELEAADASGDPRRSARAQDEREAIVAELARAYGRGGRPRRVGDTDERARQAVSWRIRDALTRIERVHPALAQHLRASVRVGAVCAYDPVDPVEWSL
jgi:hypothetical protein